MAGCRKKAPTTKRGSASALVWIVDPIDGTRGYLAGREDWCVSVALVEDAAPVLAAVFAPASDEFFFAARGQGATRNDRPVRATAGTELDFSRVAGPKPLVRAAEPVAGGDRAASANRIAGAAAVPGRARAASMPLLPAARAATGTLPRRI